MSRPKRQKIDRESNAAYAASQPLFDTLRTAATKISEQEAHLTDARNVVQTVHVKIANNDRPFSIERHNRYMDAAVKAWHSATETYCSIFEQLVTITAADPTEGREKGQRHEEFVSLLETARKAEEVAQKFDTAKEDGSSNSADEEDDVEPAARTNGTGKRPMAASESESVSEEVQEPEQSKFSKANKGATPTPTQKQSVISENIRYDKSGTKILWQDGKLQVPPSSLTADEQRAWAIIKERQRRKDRLSRFKKGKKEQKYSAGTMQTSKEIPEGCMDVSAEVEARLQAKRDKKAAEKAAEKAKREQKKRKRESGDSFTTGSAAVDSGFTNAGGEAEEDPLGALEETLKQKPAKKRARKSQEVEEESKSTTPAHTPGPSAKSKRKKSLEAEAPKADEGTGKASKKRKKTSA